MNTIYILKPVVYTISGRPKCAVNRAVIGDSFQSEGCTYILSFKPKDVVAVCDVGMDVRLESLVVLLIAWASI